MEDTDRNLNNPDPNKKNKFLFDLHNFDTPNIEEIEETVEEIEVEPPPPSFTEEELEAEKAIAHLQGMNEGRAEEKGKRDQLLANTLQQISENFSSLFAAEVYREKQYEEESLTLTLKVISLLAPSLNSRLGEEALKSALSDVLKRQSGQSSISVEVSPDSASDIDKYIENIWLDKDNAPHYKVVANSALETGACQISWEDGGMIRDPQKTAQDIKETIEALLVEQVISNPNSSLTQEENNGINKEETSDSIKKSTSKASEENLDGEETHD